MNNTTDSTQWSADAIENLAVSIFYMAVFLFGSTGNILVLLIVKRKRVRTFNDMFIVNLAVSDLGLIFFCIPAFSYKKLSGFKGSKFYCKAIWPMMTVSLCSSIFTITLMAIYRCRVILHPFEPLIKKRNILPLIVGVWVFSISMALPLLILGNYEEGKPDCFEDWPSETHQHVYTIILMVIQYFLPLLIIAVAYVRIATDLTRSKSRRLSLTTQSQKIMGRARREENLHVIKMLATIVMTFAMFMLPGHIAWMLLDFGTKDDQQIAETIFKFSDGLAIFQSCLNPVIYGTLTKQFRQGYAKYLSYVFCCDVFRSPNKLSGARRSRSRKGTENSVKDFRTRHSERESMHIVCPAVND